MNCNLLVTTCKYKESDASDELSQLLDMLGDKEPSIEITSISGIILANTRLDPLQIVENCREMVINEPWILLYVIIIIQLEKICSK